MNATTPQLPPTDPLETDSSERTVAVHIGPSPISPRIGFPADNMIGTALLAIVIERALDSEGLLTRERVLYAGGLDDAIFMIIVNNAPRAVTTIKECLSLSGARQLLSLSEIAVWCDREGIYRTVHPIPARRPFDYFSDEHLACYLARQAAREKAVANQLAANQQELARLEELLRAQQQAERDNPSSAPPPAQ